MCCLVCGRRGVAVSMNKMIGYFFAALCVVLFLLFHWLRDELIKEMENIRKELPKKMLTSQDEL